MEEIPTMSELIEAYDNGQLIGNKGSWYKVYMTALHKENNSIGFIPYVEIAGHSEFKKYCKAIEAKAIWGK